MLHPVLAEFAEVVGRLLANRWLRRHQRKGHVGKPRSSSAARRRKSKRESPPENDAIGTQKQASFDEEQNGE